MLRANIGVIDRALRIVVGLALLAFALGFIAPGASFRWIGWIGVVPLLTGALGSCPAYSLLGLSTCPVAPRA